tara:strand:+ start:357 stop:566 length:210 start_codon:yes stop_codon:yes gene_type:complete
MTYRIIRFYKDDEIPSKTIDRGLTLEEARSHCGDPETSSSTCKGSEGIARTEAVGDWFDGYENEEEEMK